MASRAGAAATEPPAAALSSSRSNSSSTSSSTTSSSPSSSSTVETTTVVHTRTAAGPSRGRRASEVLLEALSTETSKGGYLAGQAYPMFVLPASRVLTLERVPTHEEVRAELREWRAGMPTLFVSQTWLTYAHPDNPNNDKLRLLKSFLSEAAAGRMTVCGSMESESTYGKERVRLSAKQTRTIAWVWFDFWSVPQADPVLQAAAIATLPSYVGVSDFFLVLTPPLEHESGAIRDYRAWMRRGWCRVEALSNVLARNSKQIILMQSRSDIVTYGAGGISGANWINSPIGVAEFTVEADRYALGPVIAKLIDDRMAAKRAEGTKDGWRWARALHSLKARLLAGTGVEVPPVPKLRGETELEAWLSRLGFKSATETDADGWSPLRYAVMEGREDIARALLDAGADVNVRLKAHYPALCGEKGANCFGYAFYFAANEPVIRLLVERGADWRVTSAGTTMLRHPYAFGDVGNLEVLHELVPHSPSLPAVFPLGGSYFAFALWVAKRPAVEWLLTRFPEQIRDETTGWPHGVIALALFRHGYPDVLELVLDSGRFELEYYEPKRTSLALKMSCAVARVMLRLQRHPHAMFTTMSFSFGTALHMAAFRGNTYAVERLLERRADAASRRHQRRMTPLHVAAVMGHDAVCARLLRAGAPDGARDDRGRTAATWASKRGHHELARMIASRGRPSVSV